MKENFINSNDHRTGLTVFGIEKILNIEQEQNDKKKPKLTTFSIDFFIKKLNYLQLT